MAGPPAQAGGRVMAPDHYGFAHAVGFAIPQAALTKDTTTQVKCPFHNDRKPSGYWGISEKGWPTFGCTSDCDGKWTAEQVALKYHQGDAEAAARMLLQYGYPIPKDREIEKAIGRGKIKALREELGVNVAAPRGANPEPVHEPDKSPFMASGLTVVEPYIYESADAEPLYANVRYTQPDGDKTFRAWHHNGTGWKFGNSAEAVPYLLPDLIAGAAEAATIYVVEGEKDAERLTAEGEVATTSDQRGWGSGWGEKYLTGATVVIVADRDLTGSKKAQKALQDIEPHAASVVVLESATGGPKADVSDHLDAGYGLDALVPWTRTGLPDERHEKALNDLTGGLVKMSAVTPKPMRWWWRGMMLRGLPALVAGDGGTGKSTMLCELVAMVTRGVAPPGGPGYDRPRGGVILTVEEDTALALRPRLQAAEADLDRIGVAWPGDDPITLPSGEERLAAVVEMLDAGIIILDTGPDLMDDPERQKDGGEVGKFFAPLTRIAAEFDCIPLVVAHLNKSSGAVWQDRITGIRQWLNKPRQALGLAVPFGQETKDTNERYLISGIKANHHVGHLAAVATLEQRPIFQGSDVAHPIGATFAPELIETDANAHLRRLDDPSGGGTGNPVRECRELLEQILSDRGPMLLTDLERELTDAECSGNAIREAKAQAALDRRRPFARGPYWVKLHDQEWPEAERCLVAECEGIPTVGQLCSRHAEVPDG